MAHLKPVYATNINETELKPIGLLNKLLKLKLRNNYLPKYWKVLFSKPRFIEIFFSSNEVRASAEIVRDESRFGNRTF